MATHEEYQREHEGWKIMRLLPSGVLDSVRYNTVCNYNGNEPLVARKTYHPHSVPEYYGRMSGCYPTSFHCCLTREGALKWASHFTESQNNINPWVLVKVYYRGVTVIGNDADGIEVHVATAINFSQDFELLTFDDKGKITNVP